MSRLTQLLLIWFVALALPMQGLAAAVRLSCASVGTPAHGQHGQAAMHQHADPAAHTAHGAHAVPGSQVLADAPTTLVGAEHSCSACAACCVGAGLTAPVLGQALVIPQVQAASFLAFSVGPVRFVTDGPDRPPRLLAA